MNILVVDDNPALTTLIKELLLREHFNVEVAENGKKAIDIVTNYKQCEDSFSLIILDLMMPEMTGEETLKALTKIVDLEETKICILSALSGTTDIEKYLKLGACDYVVKPFDNSLFISKINEILSLNRTLNFHQTTSRIFAKIIIEGEKSKRIKINQISEKGISFSTSKEITDTKNLKISCVFLAENASLEESFMVKIRRTKQQNEGQDIAFQYEADFVGLKPNTRSKLRKLINEQQHLDEVYYYVNKESKNG